MSYFDQAKKVIAGGVNSPVRAFAGVGGDPVFMKSAKGAWLETEDGACCKILGTLTPDPVINGEGAGIAIRKDDGELKDMLNKAIEAILANGKYKEINDKYFTFDVYGG